MISNDNSTGSIAKTKKLITVLKKCNGKAAIGNSEALISPKAVKVLLYCCLVVVTVGLSIGAYIIQPFISQFAGVEKIAQVLMLGILILSFILAIKDTITVLYSTDDLELLLPMPFSATQIVMAKLAVASVFPVGLSIVTLNSICIGAGIHAGVGLPFIIGVIISSILMPITGISIATLLIVVVFRVFGVMRNRDVTVALGGIFSFAISIAYIVISNTWQGDSSETFSLISYISEAIPTISFMNSFMIEGNIIGLLISVSISALIMLLATLAVKAFYFSTALAMQNTGKKNSDVSKALKQNGKKENAKKALTSYEAKSTKRNPAYMIYGFVMSFVWPVLFILPFILGKNSLGEVSLPFSNIQGLIAFMLFALFASCFACGFNVLPGTAFSREGDSFSMIRTLPVDYADYYKSKRNFSLTICSLGSVLYVIILGIVAIALGVISIENSWVIPLSACFGFFLNIICISLLILKNSKRPNFNWDSETEISRKLGIINTILIILGVIALVVFIGCLALLSHIDISFVMQNATIICISITLISLVLAIVINKISMKKTVKNLMAIE